MIVITRKNLIIFQLILAVCLAASGQAFAWTMTSDFENGTVGSIAQGTSGFVYAGANTKYSSDRAASGSKSVKMSWTPGNEGWNLAHGEFNYPSVREGGELWVRGYYYFQSPWNWSNQAGGDSRIKTLRISVPGQGRHSIILTNNGTIIGSNEVADVGPYTNTAVDLDAWNCLELYVKLSSTAGVMRIWKNGVLVFEDTKSRTLLNSSGYADNSIIMSTWNNNVTQAQIEYVDDFVMTNERPSQVDSKGNPMIGPLSGTKPAPSPLLPPTGLRVIY